MRKLLLFLLFSISLFPSSFYDLTHLTGVQDCVHIPSGQVYLYAEDPLSENISLHRAYREGQWGFFPHTRLVLCGKLIQVKKGRKKKKKKRMYIHEAVQVADPNGCLLTYHLSGNDRYVLEFPQEVASTAKETLKNQSLHRLDLNTFKMICPNGTEKIFSKSCAQDPDIHFLLQSEQLANGLTRIYEYDSNGRVSAIHCNGQTCVFHYNTDYDFSVLTPNGEPIFYRSFGDLLRDVQGPNLSESFEYTGNRLQKFQKGDGQSISIEYTQDNKVRALQVEGRDLYTFSYFPERTEMLQSDKSKTVYRFSSPSLLHKIEKFSPQEVIVDTIMLHWSDQGELLSKVVYNREGIPTFSQSFQYDPRGNPIWETCNGKETVREFDSLNRIVKEKCDKEYFYEYVGNTHLLKGKFALGGNRISYDYGETKELKKVTIDSWESPTFSRVLEIEGGAEQPTAIFERVEGKLLRKTTYAYTPEGILEEVFNPDGTLCLSQKIKKSEIRRPWEALYLTGISFEEGWEVERDFLGHIVARRKKDPNGETLLEETWQYDAMNPVAYTDPSGLTTRYFYNKEGRKEKETIETTRGNLETLFFYDKKGRVEKMQKGQVVTRFEYNRGNRIIGQSEEDIEGNILSKISCKEKPKSRKPSRPQRDPPGVHRVYNCLHQLTELYTEDGTVHYTVEYNKRGQPTRYIDHVHGSEGGCNYDELGNLLQETLLNGLTLTSSYDLQGRRTQFVLPDNSQVYYTYGPKYLEEIYRKAQKHEYRHRFMQYNLVGFPIKQRLIEGFGELSYSMDETMCICAIHSRYLDQDTVPKQKNGFNSHSKPYTYKCDGLGRIVQIAQQNKILSFTYDLWNRRLTKRVEELIDNEWEETLCWVFLYDGDREIGVMDLQENRLCQLRVCAPHPINPGDHAIAYELEGMPYAPLYDLYGNVHKLLSVIRGKVMETYFYSEEGREKITDVWGEVIPSSKANNPWRFGCHRIDEETGLLFMDGVYYDPHLHTFLTQPEKRLPPPHLYGVLKTNYQP